MFDCGRRVTFKRGTFTEMLNEGASSAGGEGGGGGGGGGKGTRVGPEGDSSRKSNADIERERREKRAQSESKDGLSTLGIYCGCIKSKYRITLGET